MRRRLIVLIPIGIAAIFIFSFLGGHAVRLLWNWLLPPLFGFQSITFWQGLGLLALCRILFGGLGLRDDGSHYRRRWQALTPEEKERIRERMRERPHGYAKMPPS